MKTFLILSCLVAVALAMDFDVDEEGDFLLDREERSAEPIRRIGSYRGLGGGYRGIGGGYRGIGGGYRGIGGGYRGIGGGYRGIGRLRGKRSADPEPEPQYRGRGSSFRGRGSSFRGRGGSFGGRGGSFRGRGVFRG